MIEPNNKRAESGEHFDGALYYGRYLSKRGFHFYQVFFDMDAYFLLLTFTKTANL
jgi:hypothetical protein